MLESTTKRGFKAIAVACAVLLTCATAQVFTSTINYTTVNAVSVTSTYDVDKNDDGTTTGKIHINTGNYDTVTVTFSGGKAGATTSGEVGYWDGTANKWVGKVDTWEEKKFDNNGKLSITVKVPKNTNDVQIMLTYYADWSSGKENNLDMSIFNTKNIQVESGSSTGSGSVVTSESNNPPVTKPPTTPSSSSSGGTTSSSKITYDVEKNTDGTTTGKIHLDTGDSDTVTVTFSGGKPGATTSGEVGYWDSTTNKWIGKVDTWEEKKFDNDGKVSITVKVPKNTKDVQIMLTYYADWSSGSENNLDMNTFSENTISVTGAGTPSQSGSGNTNPSQSGSGSSNPSMPSEAQCNWTDITEGTINNQSKNLKEESVSDGKKTVSLVQGGQWSAYDEGNEPIILDQTWEPEVEGQYDTDRGNDVITNSNNFMFSEDLGVPTNAEIDHFRFTVESDEPMLQVQFGAGISVKKGCEIANSGSTDASGTATDNIWFNESGTFDPDNEDDYASLTNKNGKKYYGFNRGKEVGETNYIQLQWNVYDDVKPYIQNDSWSSVSFQYWYGVDPSDWDKIDWEDPNHPTDIDHKPTQVNVTEATCSYSLTETYDYTDTVTKSVDLEAFNDMNGVKFSELGLTENDKPKAVTFTVSGTSDIGKLVGAFGVSVDENCPTDNLKSDKWYQSNNVVYEDCGSTYEITWVIPSEIADYIKPEYDAEVKFGAWYAGAGENALSSIKITNVAVDYYTEEEVSTTTSSSPITTISPITTTSSSNPVTTDTPSPITTTPPTTSNSTSRIWGDANCDGQVRNNDVQMIRQHILHLDVTISEDGMLNSDVTHDGDIRNNDVQMIRQYILHIIDYSDLEPKN